ncbi:uncharacterized protein [Malus domestica]|uniref:uncharacterized protein n=1 Tax=Malus domestica TaxID=3750 RepID=UPI003975055E
MGWATGLRTEMRPKSSGRVTDTPAKPGCSAVDETKHGTIIVITVISLTVMKVKTLKVRLSNINVQELTSVPVTPSFDTKFTTQIRVKSTNWGPYKFDASTVSFLYRGAAVRQVVIPKSKAGMLSTKKINVAVTLNSNVLSCSNLGSELRS